MQEPPKLVPACFCLANARNGQSQETTQLPPARGPPPGGPLASTGRARTRSQVGNTWLPPCPIWWRGTAERATLFTDFLPGWALHFDTPHPSLTFKSVMLACKLTSPKCQPMFRPNPHFNNLFWGFLLTMVLFLVSPQPRLLARLCFKATSIREVSCRKWLLAAHSRRNELPTLPFLG